MKVSFPGFLGADVLVHLHHAFPPEILDVFLEFAAPLAVIIYSLQPVVDLGTGKNKAILLAMRNDRLEFVAIVCHKSAKIRAGGERARAVGAALAV